MRTSTRPTVPKPVTDDAHIRIVSPSWPTIHFNPQRARRAERELARLGFRFSYGRWAAEVTPDGSSAGTAHQRADDLMEAFADPEVDVIFTAAGGATTAEVLPLLDLDVIRANPKPFIGYCDNVWLNHHLYEAGLYSYFGVAFVMHLGEPGGVYPEIERSLRQILLDRGDVAYAPNANRTNEYFNWQDPALEPTVRTRNVAGGWHWIRHGTGQGRFIGAELQVLPNLIDHFGIDLRGAVLFWEVAPTTRKTLPFMLKEVARRGDLGELAGMVVGGDVRHEPRRWAKVVSDALTGVLGEVPFPVVVNADIGHLDPVWVVPYGMDVVLNSSADLRFLRPVR